MANAYNDHRHNRDGRASLQPYLPPRPLWYEDVIGPDVRLDAGLNIV